MLRSVLRPVLRAVIRRPGNLYHPLYIQDVPTLDVLEGDVQTLAETEGVPVYFWRAGTVPPSVTAGTRAVLVAPIEEAAALRARLAVSPAMHQQVLLWGTAPVSSLPPDIAAWVQTGLAFAPSEYARDSAQDWSMGPTLARAARDPGRAYNPVVLVGPTALGPLLTQEALIRLEAGGVPANVFVGLPTPEAVAVQRARSGTGLVIHLAQDVGTPAAAEVLVQALETLRARQVQIVLVADARLVDAQAAAPSLGAALARGITLILGGAERKQSNERESRRAHYLTDIVQWPSVADVLAGPPRIGDDASRLFGGQASVAGMQQTLALTDTVQWLGMTRISGRLIVYDRTHVGAMDFENGAVVHASVLGDPWSLERLLAARDIRPDAADASAVARTLIEDRAARMGQWEETHFALIAAPRSLVLPPNERTSLSVARLVMEMSRRLDEAPERRRRVGGVAGCWIATGAGEASTPDGARLLAALDGVRSVAEAALLAGVLEEEALEQIEAMASGGLVRRVIDRAERPSMAVQAPHAVAIALLAWGMQPEALTVLGSAERAGALTPEGYALQAHLTATVDPHSATADFRRAADLFAVRAADVGQITDRQGVLDATLNAALLEVRGGQQAAADRWTALRSGLSSLTLGLTWTVRHAMLVAELALRAGDDSAARQVVGTLQDVPDHAAVLAQFDAIIAGLAQLGGPA
jgi:hypothetical protein